MKLNISILLLAPALSEAGRVRARPSEGAFLHLHTEANTTQAYYGNPDCPCIGIDNIEGATLMEYNGQHFSYPADVGARCNTWEKRVHPDCMTKPHPPEWCRQSWCYVNPCNCKLDAAPKPSAYMKEERFQGKPIHYSYVTCGSIDLWSTSEAQNQAQHADNSEVCAAKPHPALWGHEKCQCIGIDGQRGRTEMQYQGEKFTYPADVGARCDDWEGENHPECKGKGASAPEWCHKKWCYVDPCSCNISTPSKPSAFLEDARFQGRPIHYSYATCGNEDAWSTDAMKEQAAQAKENADLCGHPMPTTTSTAMAAPTAAPAATDASPGEPGQAPSRHSPSSASTQTLPPKKSSASAAGCSFALASVALLALF